jgi:predicted DNA binding CopG/RHH family protein
MKKAKQFHKKSENLSHDQIVQFLDDFGKIVSGRDKKTKLISVRVPENILDAFKLKAQYQQKKYQSVIVQLMREWAVRE